MSNDVMQNSKTEKAGFFTQLKAEFKKIIWTDKKTLTKQTIAVVAITAILCVIISLVDTGALAIIKSIVR